MDMQNVAKLNIPEGDVRTIHDKDGNLIWGKVSYGVKYKGDTAQTGAPTPDAPVAVKTATGENVVKISDGQGNEQSYEVNLGKNLFDKNNYTDVTGHYIGSSGKYNSTSNGHVAIVQIEPNMTYTVSKVAQESNNRLRVGIADELMADGTTFSIWGGSDSATSVTLTSGGNSKYMYIYYAVNANVDTALETLQIEKGSQATSYAAYFTPIELCKIGTYQDYIYKSGGKWYVWKEIGKVVKTGASSETWTKSNSTANNLFIGIQLDMMKDNSSLNFPVYSDRFLYKDRGTIYAQSIVGITTQTTGGRESAFRIGLGIDSSVNTVALFRTWLSDNPTTIYYPLATPTDTEITNEALVAQLEAVEQWLIRYGYNATVSGNLPIIIDRTAL